MHIQKSSSLTSSSDYFITSLSSWNLSHPQRSLYLISSSVPCLHLCSHRLGAGPPHFFPEASLPALVSHNLSQTMWLSSKMQAPRRDGPGSLWFSPCQHFRPHLPLIHSPPSPLAPHKTNPLRQGKWWIFFKWSKKRLLVLLSSPVHPTGLFSSFFAFELFYFYKL